MLYNIRVTKENKEDKRLFNENIELTINFNKRDSTFLDFLLLHKDQSIVINIDASILHDDVQIEIFKEIHKKYPNLRLKIQFIENIVTEKDFLNLSSIGLPFFIQRYVSNWTHFNSLIKAGVSDILISEDLCFDLERVSKVAFKNKVQIRTSANVCQNPRNCDPLTSFFIRPEDIDIYEPYIDVLDFYGKDSSQLTYYKIYAVDKKWIGELKNLILGFDENLKNFSLLPDFASYRTSCRLKCLAGEPCFICPRIIELSKALEKNSLGFDFKEMKNKE